MTGTLYEQIPFYGLLTILCVKQQLFALPSKWSIVQKHWAVIICLTLPVEQSDKGIELFWNDSCRDAMESMTWLRKRDRQRVKRAPPLRIADQGT